MIGYESAPGAKISEMRPSAGVCLSDSAAAAPIARDIVKAYYDKKQGKLPPQELTTQAVPGIPPSFAAQSARASKPNADAEEGVPTKPDPVAATTTPVATAPVSVNP